MKPLLVLPFSLLAALALRAEPPHWGIQGTANLPLRGLKELVDSQPGAGIGLHGTFDFLDGHMLRPRLDYVNYQERQAAPTLRTRAAALSAGCDYLYFIAEKPERLYFTVGVAMAYWTFDRNEEGIGKTTRHATKPCAAAGVGYQWSEALGAEIRYLHGTTAQTTSADALQAGITLRF